MSPLSSPSGRFVAAVAIVLAASSEARAQLNENCTVSVLNRTVSVNRDGTWVLPNIPATFGPVRARATCIIDGQTVFGESAPFLIPQNGNVDVPRIVLGPATPIPTRVSVTAPTPTLTAAGDSVQLVVTATYTDATTRNVSAGSVGTKYRVSNSAIATITADGLVQAVTSGTVLIQASLEGAAGMTTIQVAIANGDTDGDGIPDDVELANGLDPNNPIDALEDPDRDGLTSLQEVNAGTDPHNADTDGDGLLDGEELAVGTSPLLRDTDGDGVGDGLERQIGTDPLDAASVNLAQALLSITVVPSAFTLVVSTQGGDASQQLVVTGRMRDGATLDLTSSARGTTYDSSAPVVCNFAGADGQVAAGQAGACTITVTNSGFTAQATGLVQVFTPAALSYLSIPGFANNVALSGNYAYIAAGSAGLHVVDVSNRAAPATVATLDTPGNANDVALVGTRAYVADGPGGLRIIDIESPLAPVALGSIGTPGGDARDVSVVAGKAFVADGAGGLHIIDVTAPATPAMLGTATFDGEANGVGVSGNIAIVAAGSFGTHAIDVTNPGNPVLIGTAPTYDAQDVTISSTFAFVADSVAGMIVLDLTLPIDASWVGTSWSGALTDIAVAGGFALASEASNGSQGPVFNIADPVNPSQTITIDFNGFRSGDFGTGIAADGTYNYLTAARSEDYVPNGSSGDTRLYIGQYRPLVDTAGVPPTVAITSPASGSSMIEDETIPFEVTAADDVAVASVTFVIDGVDVFTDTTAPYQFTVTAPVGAANVVLGATARDLAGNVGVAANVDVAVNLDPLTTVIGRVVRFDAGGIRQPIAGATVSTRGESAVSGVDGTFAIPGVRTARPGLRTDATITDAGSVLFGSSAPVTPVRSSPTDVGDIILGSATFATNIGHALNGCRQGECSIGTGPLPFAFPFYGTTYNELFVNSWGNVTFVRDAQPGGWFDETQHKESVAGFLNGPARIAAFWDDLMVNWLVSEPSNVYLQTGLPGQVIVTWLNNREFSLFQQGSITAQLVLFEDGRIQMAYRDVSSLDAIVGLSPGNGATGRVVDLSATSYLAGASNEAVYEQFEVPNPTGNRDDVAIRNNPFDLAGSFLTFTPNAAGGYDVLRLPDSIAPICTITSPANGATLLEGQPIVITATASDGLGVLDVTFRSNDGSLTQAVTTSPYTVPFTVPVGVNPLTLTVSARDAAGNIGTCTTTVSVVAAPAPTVTVTAPAPGTQVVAGSTVTVQVQATSPIPLTAVRGTANGVPLPRSHAVTTTFQLTVPQGATSLTIGAFAVDNAGRTGNATGVPVTVTPDPLTTLQGRVVDTAGIAQAGATVSAELHGITAEVFHFPTPLLSLPDLTGLTPDVVKVLPAVNLRNPGQGLGVDPFEFGSSPSRVIRFTGHMEMPAGTRLEYTLGSNHGAQLLTNGFRIIDMPDTGQYQERSGTAADFLSGWVPIQLIALDVAGDLDLQLLVRSETAEGPPLALLASQLEPVLSPFEGQSDAAGLFSIPNVPTTMGTVGVTALVTPATGVPLRRQDPPLVVVTGGSTDFGDVDVVPYQPIFVEDAWAPGLFRVDQVTGARRMIAVSDDIRGIRAITALRSGLLAVTVSVPDPFGAPVMVGKLLIVDPRQPFDRNQQVISEGNLFEFPFAVAEEPGGTLLVKDQGQQRIIRVDPAAPFSANQTLVASGLPFGSQYDFTVESAASALWSSNADGLLRVDLQTGTFAPVPLTFGCPYGVTMEGSNILFTTSCAQAAIYRLTPEGVRTRILLWSGAFPAALAVDFTGNIIVGGIDGSLWRVHPTTGVRTQIIAPYVGFSLGGYTNSIAVLPPK